MVNMLQHLRIERQTMTKHPLIADTNKQYVKRGQHLIKELELELTVEQMIGACLFNRAKYYSRDKGTDHADTIKAEAYERYLVVLETCSYNARPVKLVSEYFKDAGKEFSYD